MLQKIILSLTLTALPFLLSAKMAKWLVHPIYESIILRENGIAEIGKNNKYGLMRPNGDIIVEVAYDEISQFNENIALLYVDNKFVGFTDRTGRIVDLADMKYSTPYPEIGFSQGYLIVENPSYQYQYVDYDGEVLVVRTPLTPAPMNAFDKAYPFFESYAVVQAYENPVKPDKTFPAYISLDDKRLYKFPNTNPTDVNFLSSFHNHEALAVIKKKFYFVKSNEDGHINDLQQILVDVEGLKKPVPIELNDKEVNLTKTKYGYFLEAKNGEFKFDKYLRLTAYRLLNNDWVEIEFPEPEEKEFESNFSKFTDDSSWGLKYFDSVVLPPQFDQVRYMRGDNAIVGINGKYGIVTVDKDAEFEFNINNHEAIGFKHQYFDSKATLRMPTFIKKLSESSFTSVTPGFDVKKETRGQTESYEGNFITYDCRIAVPSDLTHTLTPQTYDFVVKYDGLTSPVYSVPVTEWYVKIYEVDMPVTEFQVNKDEPVQVEFELKSRDGNMGDYFKTVEVKTMNPLYSITLKQISEDHFLLTLDYCDSEVLPFRITVQERGCPTMEFPFEALFTPATTKKNAKTKVTINPIL